LVALAPHAVAPAPLAFDVGDPPAIVMERIEGRARALGELDLADIERFAGVHRSLYRMQPTTRRPATGHPERLLRRARVLIGEQVASAFDRSGTVTEALRQADRWLAGRDAVGLARTSDREVWCRGDPNSANYLWSDGAVRLLDFEDAGFRDPLVDLADVLEHAANRDLTAVQVGALIDAWCTTPADIRGARRLLACFWLALLERRDRAGQPPRQVAVAHQAERVLGLLSS
jgi:aminoglycoside phosphotransferase (APT) family kinase protein